MMAIVASMASGLLSVGRPLAAGQTLAGATATASTATASILGRVVDATTGAPIDDAVVSLELAVSGGGNLGGGKPQARPLPMLVNGRGQFVFQSLPAGAATLRASAPGYIDSGSGVRLPGGDPVPVNVADGQHLADVTIRMWPLASIEGTILDESGEPIADVPVHLLQRTAGQRRVTANQVVRTDDRGVFRFASLEPGQYLVAVQSSTTSMPASVADNYVSQLSDRVAPLIRGQLGDAPHPSIPGFRVGGTLLQPSTALIENAPPPGADGHVVIYRTTFYPAAGELSQAEAIDVAAGDEHSGITLTLPLVETVSVSGVVADASNLLLRLVPADVDDWIGDDSFVAASTTTDDDGAFVFLGVPPGRYVIEGTANQGWVRSPVTVANQPVANLSLAERPGLKVTGRYLFVGSRPAPADFGRGGFAWLTPLRNGGESKPVALDAPDGQFSIDGCQPGRYAFQVSVLNGQGASWTAASITADGKDVMAQPFDLEADLSNVVITLTDRPTEIAGTVGGGDEPLEVVVFPADYQAASDAGTFKLRQAVVSVSAGRFTVQGLPVGNYLVAAIPESELPVWMRSAMREIASQATPVALTDHSRVTVDLKPVIIR